MSILLLYNYWGIKCNLTNPFFCQTDQLRLASLLLSLSLSRDLGHLSLDLRPVSPSIESLSRRLKPSQLSRSQRWAVDRSPQPSIEALAVVDLLSLAISEVGRRSKPSAVDRSTRSRRSRPSLSLDLNLRPSIEAFDRSRSQPAAVDLNPLPSISALAASISALAAIAIVDLSLRPFAISALCGRMSLFNHELSGSDPSFKDQSSVANELFDQSEKLQK